MSDDIKEMNDKILILLNIINDKLKRIEELEQQLKELPKKICCNIEELGNQGDFIEISHSKLNEIIEKYTKE